MRLTQEHARTLLLAAQGLCAPVEQPTTKDAVLAAIRQMGVLQIDTISVVARSPYLVLWSRLGTYEPRWLDELLVEGAIFEYWAHALCFLPMGEYGLYRRDMLEPIGPRARARAWIAQQPEVPARVLDRIRSAGPLRSAEFPGVGFRSSGWWDHKPEKVALEQLFLAGELMIARRENFQRVYDLRERVLPGWNDANLPTAEEARRAFALRAVRALGVAKARWVPDYYRTAKRGIGVLLDALAAEGLLLRAQVDGWAEPAYIHPDNRTMAEAITAGSLVPQRTTLLSPFDPVVWDRARALELFGFAYRIETYTPAAKRRYGYYSLPILHRGALVGRLDAKAHRKEQIFAVRAVHLESGVAVTYELLVALATTLQKCATWHNTPEVIVGECDPPQLREALRAALTL